MKYKKQSIYTNFDNEIYTVQKESKLEVIATGLLTIVLIGIIIGFVIIFQ